jgi:NAD(P)H-dependent flavin oxidoreductase YrpB (nitropropane dioxygenase family)
MVAKRSLLFPTPDIDDEGTIRTRCFCGKPARMIRNQTTQAWEGAELQQRNQRFPKQSGVMYEWLGEDPDTTGRFEGKTDTGALAAGQSSGVIGSVLPVREIMRALVDEANEALERLMAVR